MPATITRQAPAEPDSPGRLPLVSAPEAADPPAERLLRLALLASMAAGLLLRALQYASASALWLDEAALASTILHRGWAGLLRPFEYGQTAPFGFVLLQKLAVTLLGAGEHALRLWPFLAGMAALLLFPYVARRYTSRGAAVLAVAVFALAPFLIYYAGEAKQYSFDALAAVAVLACAAPFVEGAAASRRDALLLLATGVLGVWVSQPVLFVLAGAGIALFVDAWRRGDRARVKTLAGIGAAWALSFAASFAVSRRLMSDPRYLHDFWRAGFMPLPPRSLQQALWLPTMLGRIFREPLGVFGKDASWPTRIQTAAGIVAFLAGCAALWRTRRLRLAVLVLPLLLVIVAAAAQQYPLGAGYPTAGRVLVFLLPSLALLIGEGVAAVGRLRPAAARAAAVVLGAALLAPSIGYAALAVPHMRDEIKPVLAYAQENRQPGDLLYVHYRALPSFRYYAGRYGWTGDAVVEGACGRLNPSAYLDQIASLRGHRRVWFLFVDGLAASNYDERVFMTRFLDHIGQKRDAIVSAGAWLYLYDLSPELTKAGPFVGQARARPRSYDAAEDCRGPWTRP